MSIRQPYALLIVLGFRMVEFRSFSLPAGTWFWVVSSGYEVDWSEFLHTLNSQHVTLRALESRLHAISGYIAPLCEYNFRFYFPTQTVLGKVLVEASKQCILSYFQELNPQPAKWPIVWELARMHYLPAQWRASFKKGRLPLFWLPQEITDYLEGHLMVYCEHE